MVHFHKRILFSDEAHFWLNGYVNKQNCRIWSEANPQVYVETPLHPEKLTDVQELWFPQDGATCHTARATIDLLKDTFGDRLISRFGPVNWPPRSCDLTLLDYFLWSYVKSLVYADKPQTLNHLEDNIRRVIANTRPQMLEKVIENWTSRLDYIRASRGSPMTEIIFKMMRLEIKRVPYNFFLFPKGKNAFKRTYFLSVEKVKAKTADLLKQSGKITKYSVTLKVQPQIKNTESCLQQNSTITNMHPEICEADVTEGDHGGTERKTLLRSTCLQVEELQD
ncbi:DUF4817 domain-containing protein [Trichonephila clavipes]|nr:DUF4817 domain-containing protein [Trichonephila clavipes]